GKQLATLEHHEGTIRLWDLTTGKEIAKYKHEKFGPSTMAVSADGKLLALGDWNLDVVLFQLPSFKVVHTFRGLPEDALPPNKVNQQEQVSRIVNGLAFSPNGRYLAVSATNGGNWVYDVESKKLLHKYHKFNYGGPVAFSPANKLWLSGYRPSNDPQRLNDYGTTYQALDVKSGAVLHEIKTNHPPYPLPFSPPPNLLPPLPFH